MEELVGYRAEPEGDDLQGVAPDGAVVRLQRLPPERADRVAALLDAAGGDHVEALLDIGTAVNGDVVLVLPHLPTTLAELLRGSLTDGEAVTILVPLAATVDRLHDAGVAHGGLGIPAVRFDERGAAVLTGFAEGGLRRELGEARFAAAVAADEAALRALVIAVLQAAGPRAAALAAEVASGSLASAALPDALFALADPAPVRLGPRPRPAPVPEPAGRLLAPQVPAPRSSAAPGSPGRAAAWVRAAGDAIRTHRRLLAGVRLRVWLAAGASLALLAGALVLLPGHGAASAPTATAAPQRPATPPPPRAVRTPPIVPADPLAAVRVLLAERRRCLAAGSIRCLGRVESPASPVAIEDAAAVAGAGEAVAVPEAGIRLRSRSGGAAVLTAGDRTVLLVREPDGWRLRDVIGPPTSRSTTRSSSPEG